MNHQNSIRGIGLKAHLNSTASKHRNRTYADFLDMMENLAPQRYIARAFGVNKNTVAKWVEIHKDEQKNVSQRTL